MSVAKEVVLVCDMCGSRDEVQTCVLSRPGTRSMEIDLCADCWIRRVDDVFARKARPARRPTGASQTRMARTVLPPQPGEVTPSAG